MDRKTRVAGGHNGLREGTSRSRGSFWISAANYYLLTGFIVSALFFVVLGALYDGYDDTPWIVAGLAAVVFAALLVLFRELVLRRVRQRAIAERQLAHHLRVAPGWPAGSGNAKLTLERNRELLDEIRRKSDAAKVLGKLPDAHREVFDLCEEYLSSVSDELLKVRPGSPRIPALRKGRRFAAGRHRFHMLRWAELKAIAFTAETEGLARKAALAREALEAVERAIGVYPEERALVDSKAVLGVFVLSARIRESIAMAERADSAGDGREAVRHYREALTDLQNSAVEFSEREAIFNRIRAEIGRIDKMADV